MSVRTPTSKFFFRATSLLLPLAMTACSSDDTDGTDETDTASSVDTTETSPTEPTTTAPGTDDGSTTAEPNLPEGCDFFIEVSDTAQDDLITAFVEVEPNGTVCVGEGTFSFTRQLTLAIDDVVVRGAGQDLTIFDFSEQISGGNGILINSDRNTIEALTVIDTPGDGIRANDVDGVTFLNVTVGWSQEANEENGAYALYPVQSQNVTVDGCVVYGASDAGVYLGQSGKSLIQNSEAYGNVIGIEVENSTDTIVRNNYSHDNSNGLLIITLPGLDILDGKRANIYDNRLENNNVPNFGDPGTAVGSLPPGVGILVVAVDNNEIWNNTITGNNSAAIAVVPYLAELFGDPNDPDYDIYSEQNYVHDNMISGNASDPDTLVLVLTGPADPAPEVVFGGCFNPALDNSDGSLSNCLDIASETVFLNVDACAQGKGRVDDRENFACTHEPLSTDSPVEG